jgi:hypothetical protein
LPAQQALQGVFYSSGFHQTGIIQSYSSEYPSARRTLIAPDGSRAYTYVGPDHSGSTAQLYVSSLAAPPASPQDSHPVSETVELSDITGDLAPAMTFRLDGTLFLCSDSYVDVIKP